MAAGHVGLRAFASGGDGYRRSNLSGSFQQLSSMAALGTKPGFTSRATNDLGWLTPAMRSETVATTLGNERNYSDRTMSRKFWLAISPARRLGVGTRPSA